MPKNVVILGRGELSIRVADYINSDKANFTLNCIVPSLPEPTWSPLISKWARENNIKLIESGKPEDVPSECKIDLALSVFYDHKVRDSFIKRCERILNFHNGPLPKYRGMAPINWALKHNELEHGVTIHEITSDMDAGPIVSQLKYSIYPDFDEVVDVYKRSIEYAWLLFKQTIPILDKIKARPQDNSKSSYYNRQDMEKLAERRDFTREISLSKLSQKH